MNGISQWWTRYGFSVVLSCLVIMIAWGIRQTQGTVLVETYFWLTRPWQPQVDQEQVLSIAANEQLRAQVVELEYQNRELKQLLGFTEQITGEGTPAPVVGRGADQWWQQLTLGRGSSHGSQVGDVVMAPGGLVGRVEQVTPHTSRVLLVSDPTSRVGVMVSQSRHMGILRGTGSLLCVLEFFDKEPQVKVGDTVVTSGLSSLYPAGVLVGKVRSVDLNASPAPQAMVELTAPLGLLEWGVIYAYAQTPTSTP